MGGFHLICQPHAAIEVLIQAALALLDFKVCLKDLKPDPTVLISYYIAFSRR